MCDNKQLLLEANMIKNIIFDLGGVITDIGTNFSKAAFEELGAHEVEEVFVEVQRQGIAELYETGKIATSDLRMRAKRMMEIEHVTDAEFDNAWNSIVIALPKERLEFVKQLKTKYRTYLLSNINELNYEQNFVICYRDTGMPNFSEIFHKEYYSHLVGLKKPNPEIFKLVLRENNLQPHETLFVDDTLENILSARTLGIKTHHINAQQDIFSVTMVLGGYTTTQ